MKLGKFLKNLLRTNVNYVQSQLANRSFRKLSSLNYHNLYDLSHKQSKPCFVLSTGRCGTLLLTKILDKHGKLQPFHNPSPELVYYSGYAYRNYSDKSERLESVIDACRYEIIRDSFLQKKIYIETNNRITFFAHELARLYPDSRFIHLIRHPINFIKSGIVRDWYTGKNPHDEGRIKPRNFTEKQWSEYPKAYQIGWLWNATNEFIEEFKNNTLKSRYITVRAEDLFKIPNESIRIFKFLGVQAISKDKINKIIKKPVNKSSKNKFRERIEYDRLNLSPRLLEKYNYHII